MASSPLIKKVSLSEIKSKLLRPSLTSHYICEFNPPTSEGARGFFQSRIDIDPKKLYDRLLLACSDATLPGSSLSTNEINDDHTGVTERHSYRRMYDNSSDFTFYVDGDEYYVIRFFETWISYIMNEQYQGDRITQRNYFYRANFPEDYYTETLSISKFERDFEVGETGTLNDIPNKADKRALRYNFVQAYPISITSMPVSYESSQLLKCTVSFTYSRYWIQNLIANSPTLSPNSNAPGVPELSSAQVIGSVETGPGLTEYQLAPVPGQITLPPGQGGAADLLGPGLGGIGQQNPVQVRPTFSEQEISDAVNEELRIQATGQAPTGVSPF